MFLRVLLSLLFALPAASWAAPERPVELPFEFVDGFILLKAQIKQSREPLTLLLDSGAGASLLSLDTARRLGLELGAAEAVQGVGTQAQAYSLDGVVATSGGVVLSQIPLAIDLRNATVLCRRPVDGLVGVDFFQNRIVEIDYNQKHVRLLANTEGIPADAWRLPIKPYRGTLCVPVSVNGSKPRLARLDTGCNDSLHWVVPRTATRNQKSNLSIGFLTDPSDMVLSSVRLGNETLTNVETSLHGKPLFQGESGLVGSGLLSRHLVTIDLVHNQLYLQHGAPVN